jgi:hypothetical protein
MNYEESKIYKIKSLLDESQFYVGSTTSTLEKRLYQHKSNGINNINRNVHIYFINNGWNNANIELIENYPCKNKDELLFRETFWINELKPTLNCRKSRQTIEERKEYNKKYVEENKDRIKERQKQYYNNNQEKIQEYRDGRKEIRKEYDREYNIKNKEKKVEYKLQYNNENRDRVLEKKKEKILCECGDEHTRTNKSRHIKTKKHLDHINK